MTACLSCGWFPPSARGLPRGQRRKGGERIVAAILPLSGRRAAGTGFGLSQPVRSTTHLYGPVRMSRTSAMPLRATFTTVIRCNFRMKMPWSGPRQAPHRRHHPPQPPATTTVTSTRTAHFGLAETALEQGLFFLMLILKSPILSS